MKRQFQNLGKALMQPVAVMPAAAILMGIGYYIDPTGWGANSQLAAFLIKAGAAILDNLGILFAVGVAYGMSKDKDGAAALAGLVGFLTTTTLLSPGAVAQLRGIPAEAFAEMDKTLGFAKMNNGNVFVGILIGCLAAWCYNRFHKTQLPTALAFFSGRRLVPIMTAFFAILTSVVLFFVWPMLYGALVAFGQSMVKLGPVGAGVYAFFNRLLIPTGLHHALNNVFWFPTFGINDIGNYWNPAAAQEVVAKFAEEGIHYVPGMYQAGFFPVMMFGLPAAALAMYRLAKPSQKKEAYALLFAAAAASFLTGVTEPIEFSFMFLAPTLYLVHAALTGVAVAIAAAMEWTSGFSFSAGLVDYVLGFNLPTALKPYMLIVLGLVFAVIYYLLFYVLIKKLDLKTPGRTDEENEGEGAVLDSKHTDFAQMAAIILEGLGGKDNIDSLDYCITRLRVDVKDNLLVDEKKIKEAKISGIIRPSQKNVQVIVGPQVQFVKDEMDKLR